MTGKAWVYDLYHNRERLIMDLSLNVGDTFIIYPNSIVYDTIAIVDLVYLENSLKKVRLNVNLYFPSDKLTFIEGVGTNVGVDYQVNGCFMGFGWGDIYLLCSYKDSSLFYKNNFIDTCYSAWYGINETNKKPRIKIFPNPVQHELNLVFSEPFEGYIIVYNVLGSVEEQIYLKNSLSYKMGTDTVNKGVYFIHVLNNGVSVTKKIIKY